MAVARHDRVEHRGAAALPPELPQDWWLPVLGLIVYFYSRGLTDELGLPVHVFMPIHVDEWLGGGSPRPSGSRRRGAATRA